jgi:hypothetical protein
MQMVSDTQTIACMTASKYCPFGKEADTLLPQPRRCFILSFQVLQLCHDLAARAQGPHGRVC